MLFNMNQCDIINFHAKNQKVQICEIFEFFNNWELLIFFLNFKTIFLRTHSIHIYYIYSNIIHIYA